MTLIPHNDNHNPESHDKSTPTKSSREIGRNSMHIDDSFAEFNLIICSVEHRNFEVEHQHGGHERVRTLGHQGGIHKGCPRGRRGGWKIRTNPDMEEGWVSNADIRSGSYTHLPLRT